MFRRFALVCLIFCHGAAHADPWSCHTIDRSSRGADGVKLGDFDLDGFDDLVTGWEEGGQIRICFQPADAPNRKSKLISAWTSMEVGRVGSPEDAVAVDFNRDGWLDVISCCEGLTKNVFVHLNPGTKNTVRDASQWTTKPIQGAANVSRWMFGTKLENDKLVFGSKNPEGQIAICDFGNVPPRWRKLRDCGWIMSLRIIDLDRDGFEDILYSDRKGPAQQVGWLRNPGESKQPWTDHLIGGRNREVMFLDVMRTLAKPGADDDAMHWTVACQTKDGGVLMLESPSDWMTPWKQSEIPQPAGTGSGKGVSLGDIDLDGKPDLVCSCEQAGEKVGVYWLKQSPTGWAFQDISGNQSGTKFDRIELMDLDRDGDLDVVTCEERNNLGVVWYENPAR
jgi:hypothetical protein